jgi:hypothetical protein
VREEGKEGELKAIIRGRRDRQIWKWVLGLASFSPLPSFHVAMSQDQGILGLPAIPHLSCNLGWVDYPIKFVLTCLRSKMLQFGPFICIIMEEILSPCLSTLLQEIPIHA